ncbi:MAG TPA: TauD/TfdA family dioxygenase [Terriglobales bacterium]|nr:TauD/TfdA family dioxygenase [Terriglobales bacterium]
MSAKITVTHPTLGRLPFVIQASPESANVPLDELLDWMTDTSVWREEQLHRAGAVLFRGFEAIRTAEDFAAVAQRMAPEILDYAGGTTPRSAVTGKIVTSTDAPRHAVIGLHQEMSYLAPSKAFPDPTPDKVMFFCETAPGGGGQTPIADMREVYKKLPRELVERFESKGGLVLHRKLPTEKQHGFEVTWNTAFGTTDRAEMEKIAKKNGWTMKWAGDGGLEVTHPPSPVVKNHRVTGEKIWFNQAHLLHMSVAPWTAPWLGPDEEQVKEAKRLEPLIRDRFYYHSTFADGTEISEQDIATIKQVIAKETVMFDWQRGDVLLVDNKLTSHGRQPYDPPRTIFAALLADVPRRPAA